MLDRSVHWTLERLRNKPHIYLDCGRWVVINRTGFDMQSHLNRTLAASRFSMELNHKAAARMFGSGLSPAPQSGTYERHYQS